jgi:hypothetical protein
MSDDWIWIVPADPTFVPEQEREMALVRLVEELLPRAEQVSVQAPGEIAFVDAGSNQGQVKCPHCGLILDDEWWSAAMTTAHESRFQDRLATLPCCGSRFDLNDLDYGDFPVAFAQWWVDCMNPASGRVSNDDVRSLANALGQSVTVVYQHM